VKMVKQGSSGKLGLHGASNPSQKDVKLLG
jgi:hypothetical protein